VHANIHGHAAKDKAVEVVSYRLRVRVSVPKFTPRAQPDRAPSAPSAAAKKATRRVFFVAPEAVEATVYDRDRLRVGAMFAGPAIVEQFDATIAVPPSWRIFVDRYRNLIITRQASADGTIDGRRHHHAGRA
jgi:N-methylhydantoinase A